MRSVFLPLALLTLLAACGEKQQQGNSTVAMKNLEVTEGSTNDAMTDLDGVQSEGTAMVDTGGNTTGAAGAKPAAAAGNASAASNAAEDKSEVVADQ